MTAAQKTKYQFTPEVDCEIIRGYANDQEATIARLKQEHGLSRDAITKRASVLGINRQFIKQLGLPEFTYGPRPCLRCEKVFLSRGSGNRLCPKCTKQGG